MTEAADPQAASEPSDAEHLLHALRDAAESLRNFVHETIGDPVFASLAAVDADDLSQALKQVEVRERRQLLGELGLHGGKSPTLAVAGLALRKLRNSDPQFKRWAALILSWPTWAAISHAGRNLSHFWRVDDPAAAAAVAATADAPRSLVRLAIAAWWAPENEIIAPAPLAQLFEDEFILDEWRELREDMRARCSEASTQLGELLMRMGDVLDVDETHEEAAPSAEEPVELAVDAGSEEGAAMNEAEAPDHVGMLLDVARLRHQDAIEAAARLSSALLAGSPAEDADVDCLLGFTSAFAELREHVVSLGASTVLPAVSTLAEAEAAIDAIEAEQARRRPDVSGLEAIAALPETHQLLSLYRGARDRAISLLARPPSDWTDDEESDARQLAAIAAANEAAVGGSIQSLSADDFSEEFRGVLGLAIGGALPIERAPEEPTADLAPPDIRPETMAPEEEVASSEADSAPSPSLDVGAPKAGSRKTPKVVQRAPATKSAKERVATHDEDVGPTAMPPSDEAAEASPVEEVAVAAGEEDAVEDQREAREEASVAVLAQLIRERRFGLAYWLAISLGASPTVRAILEVVAYADRIRSPAGECASAFRQAVENLDVEDLRSSKFAQRLAIAAAVPAAVFSPYSGATDLLRHVAQGVADHQPLSNFLAAIITAAERGVQIEADVVRRTRDLASLEAELEDVRRRAAEMRLPRTLVFARASDVWRHWIEPDGPLGSLLAAVEGNDEAEAAEIERRVLDLRDQRHLERLVDQTDRALRRKTARATIEARARQTLLKGAKDALGVVAEWVDLVRDRESRRRTEDERAWQKGPVEDLRTAATTHRDGILELTDEWQQSEDPLEASAGSAAREILDGMLLLLGEGRPLSGVEPLAYLVLGEELLKAPDVDLSSTLQPLHGTPETSSLLRAAATDDWVHAFDAREAAVDHDATQQIIVLIAQADPELAEKLEARRERSLELERSHARRLHGEALRALDAALRLAHITDEEWGRYYSLLENLEIETTLKLGAARRVLEELLDGLEQRRTEEVASARRAFDKLGIEDASVVKRVERLLEAGDVAAYQELVLSIERGLTMPEAEPAPPYLEEFFPAVIEAVGREAPHSDALLVAAEEGSAVGPFDFAAAGRERRADVVAAMNAWLALAVNDRADQEAKLRRIMWILGFEVEEIHFDDSAKHRRGGARPAAIRSADLRARPIGRALVPAFGSAADGRYRLLLAVHQVTEEALLDRVAQEPGEAPIVVLNFAFMSVDVRRGLIDQVRRQRRRPVCLVDTAAFLYACSKGGTLETLMRITLPFTAVNPYTPFVAGKVPPEMFYGRKYELESVIDPNGTSFIYGGRRLGKSALLRAAEREFATDGQKRHAIYVDLKNHGIGEWRPATDVHDVLAREFSDRKIIRSRGQARTPEELYEELAAWVEGGEERRILLLLDEADEFLNADASEGFRIVRRLKELMDRTGRRFKPVLAGLHQVQRFQSIPNQPLAHLGQPIAVGPLSPQYAFNLAVTPLEALGYRFESDEVVFRILTNTNYQPSLIQLFCDELVKHMLRRPVPKNAPPYTVTMDDVERVYGTPDLADEIRNRFELTINLDPRYRVIAYVLALRGWEAELSAATIRAECEAWWPAGFEDTTDDEFAALLDELKGLGVLYSAGGRYTMRSPNVLRMLGTHDQIEDKLLGASEAAPPQKFQAATFRAPLGDDPYRRSPLTEQQSAQLIRPETAVRIVLGSAATGVDAVTAAIETAAGRASSRTEVLPVLADRQRIRRAFVKEARGRHRVIVCDLRDAREREAAGLVEFAAGLTITPRETTASVVFVVGTDGLALWRAVLGSGAAEPHLPSIGAVVLRRWSAAGLRAWSHGQDVDLPFMDDQAVDRLLKATGGWPSLVDTVVAKYIQDHRFDAALDAVDTFVSSAEGAASFLEQTGLAHDAELLACWRELVEYGEPVEREDLLTLLGESDSPATLLELLRGLQVLDISADGRMSPERTLLRAWTKAGSNVSDS